MNYIDIRFMVGYSGKKKNDLIKLIKAHDQAERNHPVQSASNPSRALAALDKPNSNGSLESTSNTATSTIGDIRAQSDSSIPTDVECMKCSVPECPEKDRITLCAHCYHSFCGIHGPDHDRHNYWFPSDTACQQPLAGTTFADSEPKIATSHDNQQSDSGIMDIIQSTVMLNNHMNTLEADVGSESLSSKRELVNDNVVNNILNKRQRSDSDKLRKALEKVEEFIREGKQEQLHRELDYPCYSKDCLIELSRMLNIDIIESASLKRSGYLRALIEKIKQHKL